jgi:hypothetical protein
MTLKAGEFMRCFLLHVLPDGFHRIRNYGLLANGHRAEKLALCRKLLEVPSTSTDRSSDDDNDRDVPGDERPPCPCCGGRMQIIESFIARDICASLSAETPLRPRSSHRLKGKASALSRSVFTRPRPLAARKGRPRSRAAILGGDPHSLPARAAALTVLPRPFGKRGWSERPARSRINRLAADVDCERDRYRT